MRSARLVDERAHTPWPCDYSTPRLRRRPPPPTGERATRRVRAYAAHPACPVPHSGACAAPPARRSHRSPRCPRPRPVFAPGRQEGVVVLGVVVGVGDQDEANRHPFPIHPPPSLYPPPPPPQATTIPKDPPPPRTRGGSRISASSSLHTGVDDDIPRVPVIDGAAAVVAWRRLLLVLMSYRAWGRQFGRSEPFPEPLTPHRAHPINRQTNGTVADPAEDEATSLEQAQQREAWHLTALEKGASAGSGGWAAAATPDPPLPTHRADLSGSDSVAMAYSDRPTRLAITGGHVRS